MVDCCSNKFKVEIFSVKYSLTDGQNLGKKSRDWKNEEHFANWKKIHPALSTVKKKTSGNRGW